MLGGGKWEREGEKALLLESEVRKTGRLSNRGLSELYWLGAERKEIDAVSELRQVGRLAVRRCKQLHPEREQLDHMGVLTVF